MENAILQRLRLFIKSKGITIKYFAELIETPEGSFKTMFNRDANPSTELLIKIFNKFPALSPKWLLMDIGEMEMEISETIGQNTLRAVNALNRMTTTLPEKEKKVSKSTAEMLKMITELSAKNAIQEETIKALRKELNLKGHLQAAEPIVKYDKP